MKETTITAHGKTQTVNEWAKEKGLGVKTIYSRMSRGLSGNDLVQPVMRKGTEEGGNSLLHRMRNTKWFEQSEPFTPADIAGSMRVSVKAVNAALETHVANGVIKRVGETRYTLVTVKPLRMAWRKRSNPELGIIEPTQFGAQV